MKPKDVVDQPFDAHWTGDQKRIFEEDMKKNQEPGPDQIREVHRGDLICRSYLFGRKVIKETGIKVFDADEDTITVLLDIARVYSAKFVRRTGLPVESDPDGVGWITVR